MSSNIVTRFSLWLVVLLCLETLSACAPLELRNSVEPLQVEEAVPPNYRRPKAEAVAKDEPAVPEFRDLAKFGLLTEDVTQLRGEPEGAFFDFPVARNDQVDRYLDYFTKRDRKTFGQWLARSGRYLPMIKKKFAEAGLPQDLAYLPMIESGFRPTALSPASAVGTWQFMRGTGLDYGLTINEYVDERRDPIKSTQAAVAYLTALHGKFDSWHLAVAAYNAGEGTIAKAMRKEESNDFWEIARGQYIHDETKRYVPQLIAAIRIAREPEKYGFDAINYEAPLEYEIVHVPSRTHLKAVALACAVGVTGIQDLNPELCKYVTPPWIANYPLRVPVGKKALVSLNLPRVREVVTTEYRDYVAAKGETLSSICKKHGIRKKALMKTNKLRHARLTPGQRIKIPYQDSHYVLLDVAPASRLGVAPREKSVGKDISRAFAFEEHGSSKRKHSKAETFKKQQDHKKLKHKPGSGSDGGKGVAATSGLKRKLRPTLSGIQKKAPSRSYAVTVGAKRPKRS